MSKCTKGEWAVGFSDQGLGHGTYGVMVKDTSEVVIKDLTKDKAEEIVRRWNAFEDGGLVDELRTALENLTKQPNCEGCQTEAKAALAKS